MDLNFNHLRNFHYVATARSLVDAARRLDMSPSTLSEQIRVLERRLGVQLFVRTPTGLKLSPAGQRVAEQTQLMWLAGERIKNSVLADVREIRRRMNLGIARTLSHTFESSLLHTLFRHAEVLISTRHADMPELAREVISGNLDFALSDSPPLDELAGTLVAEKLGLLPLVVAASGSTPLTHGLRALADLPFVHYTRSCTLHRQAERFLAEHDIVAKVIAEVDDVALMCELAAMNQAWCIVPKLSASSARDHRLEPVAELGDGFGAEVHAFWHASDRNEVIRDLIQRLRRDIGAAVAK